MLPNFFVLINFRGGDFSLSKPSWHRVPQKNCDPINPFILSTINTQFLGYQSIQSSLPCILNFSLLHNQLPVNRESTHPPMVHLGTRAYGKIHAIHIPITSIKDTPASPLLLKKRIKDNMSVLERIARYNHSLGSRKERPPMMKPKPLQSSDDMQGHSTFGIRRDIITQVMGN